MAEFQPKKFAGPRQSSAWKQRCAWLLVCLGLVLVALIPWFTSKRATAPAPQRPSAPVVPPTLPTTPAVPPTTPAPNAPEPSAPASTASAVSPAAKPKPKPKPPVAKPAPPAKPAIPGSSATTPRAYRKDAAQLIYSKNAQRIYKGKLQPLLYAVGVLEVNIDGEGRVRSLHWMRAPRHAPEVIREIERIVRAAAPYPAPTHMGQVIYTDTWLWDKSGRFQLDTLTEGQL